MRNSIIVIAACLMVTGCVQHQWAAGPGTNPAEFGRANGACKLAAMGSQQGYAAFGRPAFVAGAAIGNAIGNAIRSHQAYEACLEASGFVPVAQAQAAP